LQTVDNYLVLRAGHILQLLVIALLGIALVMIHSAAMTVGQDSTLISSRYVVYAVLAVMVMLVAGRLDVRAIFSMRGLVNPLTYMVILSLGLVGLALLYGPRINGARRWLFVGGVSIQPSELFKWTLVIAIAWWCARRAGAMHRFRHGLLPPLLLVGLGCGLILVEDLGTAALIGLVAVVLLYAGGARLLHLAMIMPVPIAAMVVAITQSDYRRARITSFLDPFADPQGIGYHAIQSMVAIAGGGTTGRGLGAGIQKFGYLPEDTSDFVFAIICEELGLAGAGLVILMYVALMWVGMSIVRDCRDNFGRLLGLGVLLTIGLQALMNLAVVTVLVPTKGIALPLISAGGSGWIATAAAVGLLCAIDAANHIDQPTLALNNQGIQSLRVRPAH
jgi:cell division protein FtsW